MPTVKCPHCDKDVEYQESLLQRVNSAVGISSSKQPDAVVEGYVLWFTGFKEFANRVDILGQCVAFPPAGSELPMYYIHTATEKVYEARRGEELRYPEFKEYVTQDDLYPHLDILKFSRVKKEAMDELARFIREKEGVAA